ncbi:MAG TPA: sodium/solute symporter [Xanthomonadales bacterium]|nr:sodium/solute symporter [Xanthomonadales bacterium]
MAPLDYAIVIIYLLVVGSIGLAVSRNQETPLKYFLADKAMPQWVVGFTLMATLISSNTLVAHPAIVFQKSMILVPGFIVMPFVLVAVAIWVVPFYRRVVGMSAYEYIGRRFGLGGRLYTSFGFLLSRIFGIGVALVTTSIAVKVMTGWPIEWVILGIGLFTILYTLVGGITAVVFTDVVQGIFLMLGGVVIVARLLFGPEISGPGAVFNEAWEAGKFSLGSGELSWASLYNSEDRTIWMFAAAMAVQWSRRYICDQAMVQRYLIARSTAEAKRGTLIGAALSVPVLIAFNVIGALLFGFYSLTGAPQPEVGDYILPHFIVNYLPAGMVGLILAAVLAASMSSVSSDLNSISTVITKDYFSRFLPGLSDRGQLRIGRTMVLLAGLVAAGIAILLVPNEGSTPLAERALVITVIVSSGALGIFCLGFFSTRATRRGCYVGIACGVMFTLWAVLTEPGNRLLDLGPFNFEMNAILIGIFGNLVTFGVGWLASILMGGYRPSDISDLKLRAPRESAGY